MGAASWLRLALDSDRLSAELCPMPMVRAVKFTCLALTVAAASIVIALLCAVACTVMVWVEILPAAIETVPTLLPGRTRLPVTGPRQNR